MDKNHENDVVKFSRGCVTFVVPTRSPDIYDKEWSMLRRPSSVFSVTNTIDQKLCALGIIIEKYIDSLQTDPSNPDEEQYFAYTLSVENPRIDITVKKGGKLRFYDPCFADLFLERSLRRGNEYRQSEIVRDFMNQNQTVMGYCRYGVDDLEKPQHAMDGDAQGNNYSLETKIWLAPELRSNNAFYEKLECAASTIFVGRGMDPHIEELRALDMGVFTSEPRLAGDVAVARILNRRLRDMGIPLSFKKPA